jgi:hypothetical protein
MTSYSNWKEGSVKRRDARHTKSSDEHRTTVPNKRNTKKWCKGKVGVEHKPKCMKYSEVKRSGKLFDTWRILVCTVCGKELGTYYNTKKNKPDWVDK